MKHKFLIELIKELLHSKVDIDIQNINSIRNPILREEVWEIIKLDRDLYITYLFNRNVNKEGIENGIDKSKDKSIDADEEKIMLDEPNIISNILEFL